MKLLKPLRLVKPLSPVTPLNLVTPLSLAAMISLGAFAPSTSFGAGGVELGVLTCSRIAGTHTSWVVHSSVKMNCVYDHVGGKEDYDGKTGIGLGLDLNWKKQEHIAFTVLGGSSDIAPAAYSLAGDYVGAKASASVGVGVGAAVLVGGGDKNISLVPIALEGNTGLGAAAGIGYISLKPAEI